MNKLNWTLILGLSSGLGVVAGALFHSSTTPWIFVNLVGFIIVAGGMTASAFIMHSFSEIKELSRGVGSCFLNQKVDNTRAINEIVNVSKIQQRQSVPVQSDIESIPYYFLRDGMELLLTGLAPDEIRRRLEVMSSHAVERGLKQSGSLLSLAKLGPGFGLLGTLLGLVVLLQQMGESGNFDQVGPALAISLLATLYGVVAANLFLQPMAELIKNRTEESERSNQLIIDGIVMLKDKKHPLQIREALKNHLSWNEVIKLGETETGSDKKPERAAA